MKVLLDTDIGGDFDDANALALLAVSDEVELVGVTTVGAGASARKRADVARAVLAAAGRPQVRVSAGADGPSVPNAVLDSLAPEHCLNAWTPDLATDLSPAPEGNDATAGMDAADAIVAAVAEHGEALVLVSIGAMTNIAAAIERDRRTMERLGGIVAMSGAFELQLREANVAIDPEAADTVYRSGIPLRLIGYEHASRPVLPLEAYASAAASSPLARLLGDLAVRYHAAYASDRVTLFDVTAVTALLRPDWFEFAPARVAVELEGLHTRGMTIVETDPFFNRVPSATAVSIAVGSSPDRVLELFRSRVLGSASA